MKETIVNFAELFRKKPALKVLMEHADSVFELIETKGWSWIRPEDCSKRIKIILDNQDAWKVNMNGAGYSTWKKIKEDEVRIDFWPVGSRVFGYQTILIFARSITVDNTWPLG